ncbi:hypothetical protein Tco_0689217 [Tanacetum coccineum]
MIDIRSKHEVYSRHKIVSVKKTVVDRKHGYGYLKNIVVKRSDQKDYEFMESDFPRLNMNDLEDMYLLKVQGKIHHLDGVDEFDMINALLLYIRRIVNKRVEDAQLGVESQSWTEKDKQSSNSMRKKIEQTLQEQRHMRRLESYVGGRRKENDVRLIVRPE